MMRIALLALAFFSMTSDADALLCQAILGCSCTVTASELDFESFDPLSGAQAGEGVVEVDCTGVVDVNPSVMTTLSAGQHGTVSARKMKTAGGDELAYNIYTTAQHQTVWGTGGAGVNINGGLITLLRWRASRTMYGLATPTTTTKPGSYSDLVTVRIVW